MMHTEIYKICSSCEQLFLAKFDKARKKYVSFCSRKCVDEWQRRNRVEVICAWCSRPVWYRPSKVQKCCTAECHFLLKAKEHRDRVEQGYVFASPQPIREDVIGDRCQLCGYNKCWHILHLHHLDGDKKNNVSSNMLCVCPNCHMEIHFEDKTGPYRANR